MTKPNCPHCGAAFTGLICDYCGALAGTTSTVEEQRRAIEELHKLIANSPREKQVLLIKNGYLPDDTAALIDAGLKCISLMDEDEIKQDRTDAAARRLESVIVKLELRPGDAETTRALLRFRERVDKNTRHKNRDVALGLSIIAGIFMAIVFLIWWIFCR
ncbi:hypothetical protein HZA73_00810 [candidate division TA06 bacterium]|nr:hypothetical protein [candidate division TA06 bacterium]